MSYLFGKLIHCYAILFCLLFFCACSHSDDSRAVMLNEKAYYYHYRSVDSTKVYADSVLMLSDICDKARAEALNNLVFYNITRMRYSVADSLVREIYYSTDDQTELCIAAIQMMRMCQRRSDNKRFYEFRQRAEQHFRRIYEDVGSLLHLAEDISHRNTHFYRRLIYAESEYRLVMSVYNYYIGQNDAAAAVLREMDSIPLLKQDTVQYVAYLYNIGSGGILTRGSKEDIRHQELEHLMQCFVISADKGYTYWKANATQSLSEHLLECNVNDLPDIALARRYLNTADIPDSLIAGALAEESLRLFHEYGDPYQEAASWRTIAYCYTNINDYPGAIYSLENALEVDTAITNAPALKASIHEQFSLAFSALGEKQMSDYHRNMYLDLYEDNRQDKELEARIEALDMRVSWLNILITIIIAVAVLLLGLLAFLIIKRRRMLREGKYTSQVAHLLEVRNAKLAELDERLEELKEQCGMKSLELSRQQEDYAEQRAKMHLINSLTPLIDRMLHETKCLSEKDETEDVRDSRCDYIAELLSRINQQNNFLTEWIQMKKGELSLRIESFSLSELFTIIAANASTIRRQGITLDIQPTDLCVKADRTLTLFMLNTLCDNARKFTPQGGTITVSAIEVADEMVEISVADTGCGMTDEQVAHLFDMKPIVDENISTTSSIAGKSHGFGLINSKGIIEKYKKTNALFSRCTFDVESAIGKGSRFYFRLPKGIKKMMMLIVILLSSMTASAQTDYALEALADSVYTSNINGRYDNAIVFARQYLQRLNAQYRQQHNNTDTLMLNDTILTVSAEIRWLRDSVSVNYQELLSVRNEAAVAALALHDWQLYHYNNNAYTQLYKVLSVDPSLSLYFHQMSTTELNSNVAVVMLVLLILSLAPIYYFTYYRYVILDVRKETQRTHDEIEVREQECQQHAEQLSRLNFEYDRLHVLNNVMNNSLSAIKHETMYYPSRLQQLLLDAEKNAGELDEVARYYRAVYAMLSSQAQYNCRYYLPVDVLWNIMLRLIAQLSGERKADIVGESQEQYTVYRFTIRHGMKQNEQVVKFNVLTLVVRDLGELYDLRRCGVNRDGDDVTVTAPQGRS